MVTIALVGRARLRGLYFRSEKRAERTNVFIVGGIVPFPVFLLSRQRRPNNTTEDNTQYCRVSFRAVDPIQLLSTHTNWNQLEKLSPPCYSLMSEYFSSNLQFSSLLTINANITLTFHSCTVHFSARKMEKRKSIRDLFGALKKNKFIICRTVNLNHCVSKEWSNSR